MPIDPVTGGIIVGGLGAIANVFGGERTNAANAREAQKNRDFQERMSSTAIQRQVKDYEAAGLNPALAYGRGGSSTPGGATAAPATNSIGNAAGSAIQGLAQGAQIAATKAQIDKLKEETHSISQSRQIEKQMADRSMELTAEDLVRRQRENSSEWIGRVVEQMKQDLRLTTTNARHAELGLPGMENMSKAAQTWWGRNVSPFLNDAKSAAAMGASIAVPGLMLRKGRIPQIERIDEDVFLNKGHIYKSKTIKREP